MGLIKTIDHGLRKVIFSLFWWFIDPLEQDRLYGELVDTLERNLDANHPEKLLAPDNYDVLVNNKIFIKHAHSIRKLETYLQDRLQKYAADRDYELPQPRVKIRILSSATISRHKADIRCWFSEEEVVEPVKKSHKTYQLKVIQGNNKGTVWPLEPGNTYKIGRISTADIRLPYEKISKHHATLYFMADDRITIVDEGSANGTFIDDEEEAIKGSREVHIGSKIQFCKLDPIVLSLTVE